MFARFRSFLLHPVTRRVIRVTRVGVISVGIYSIGRTTGSLDVLKDPKRYEADATKQILEKSECSGQDLNDIHFCIFERGQTLPKNLLFRSIASSINHEVDLGEATIPISVLYEGAVLHQQARRVQRVGTRLLDMATEIVREEIVLRETGQPPVNDKTRPSHNLLGADLESLKSTLRYLEMEDWKFLFIDSNEVNAFVHGLSPRTIYVSSGLVSLSGPSDAALAMVLGHEVAHTIYQHNERGLTYKSMLLVGQLMVLSLIDPTGLLTLAAEAGLATAFPFFDLSHDRKLEQEADHLGLLLAARACYEPSGCLEFFHRLEQMENPDEFANALGDNNSVLPRVGSQVLPQSMGKLLRTHPYAAERRVSLVADRLAAAEQVYDESGCGRTQSMLEWMIFGTPRQEAVLQRSKQQRGIDSDAAAAVEATRNRPNIVKAMLEGLQQRLVELASSAQVDQPARSEDVMSQTQATANK